MPFKVEPFPLRQNQGHSLTFNQPSGPIMLRSSSRLLASLLCMLLAACLLPPDLYAAQKQLLTTQSKRKSGTAPSSAQTKKARKAKATGKNQVAKSKGKKNQKQATVGTAKKRNGSAKVARKPAAKKQTKKRNATLATRSTPARKQPQTPATRTVPVVAGLDSGMPLPLPTDSIFDPIEAPLKLSSKSYIVMDAVSGGTLLAKNPDARRQPASTIKIITGLIALKSLGSDDRVTVSRHAAAMPSSKVYLQPAKTYSANDLINSVLLASANDASVALAERIAGSESRFARLMTYNAQRWGARNTVCRTASGLTAEGQHSTARDLAQLFRVAMQNRDFAGRMRERSVRTTFGKKLVNHNKALWRLDGAMGGKTGYTNAARQTYVGQFSRNGHTIVVAILGSESMWADLEKLVDYGFKRKNHEMARLRRQGRL